MSELERTLEKLAQPFDAINAQIKDINANLAKGKAALENAILESESDDDEYCPICGQEHNANHEYNAGYCQHCKNPVLDDSTGEFYDDLK